MAKDEINNYRPISRLIVLSIIFERVLYNRLLTYFDAFGLFHPSQFGLKERHHWRHCTINGSSSWQPQLLSGPISYWLKKKFWNDWSPNLFTKLELYGIRGVCLKWICDYLSERQQCVSFNNFNSSLLKLEARLLCSTRLDFRPTFLKLQRTFQTRAKSSEPFSS